jgi:Methyltransferase domain.
MYPSYSALRHPGTNGLFIKPLPSPMESFPSIAKQYPPQTGIPEELAGLCDAGELLEKPLYAYMEKDLSPVPSRADREGEYDDRHLSWWCSGLLVFMSMWRQFLKYRSGVKGGEVYFELECRSGRVLRHAFYQPETPLRVFGCDINIHHREWMNAFLPSPIVTFQNTILPALPLPDAGVDFFAAPTFFTHCDDFESAWLMEIARVMKDDGLAFLSVRTDAFWNKIGADPVYSWMKSSFSDYYVKPYQLSADAFSRPMPEPRLTLWPEEGYNPLVFYSREYIRENWSRFFDVLDIVEQAGGRDDLVVLRKRKLF